MKIVKIWGGLGNQLFCYGLYRELKDKYGDVSVDLSWFKNTKQKYYYPYQLKSMGLDVDVIEEKSPFFHSNCELELIRLIEKKSYGFLFSIVYNFIRVGRPKLKCFYSKNAFEYNKIVFDVDNSYFVGYWQNINYMKKTLTSITEEIKFALNYDIDNEEFQNKIKNTEAVAVHIRRNDYEFEKFDTICDDKYYQNGVDYFRQRFDNPVFYVFSNRIDAAKRILGNGKDIVYVNINGRDKGIYDMKLMSLCKGMITSNSTFSWWSAALITNNNGTVVFPKEWNKKEKELNLKLDGWIEL